MTLRPDDVLEFWLGPSGGAPFAKKALWWKKDPAFDAEVTQKFGGGLLAATQGELDSWEEEPRSCVALVVLLDQFSRNIHRGAAAAFAGDARARAVVERALDRGLDAELAAEERLFLRMPLMHSEDLAAQNRCVIEFATLLEETPEALRPQLFDHLIFAVKHRKIIARFGRFPHRNAILGRASTPEETSFLVQPGSSF